MSEDERDDVLATRKGRKLPWHSPPHIEFAGDVTFIITAACFEHASIIGKNPERMANCENDLLEICEDEYAKVFAWCILPNHYHLLVRTDNIKNLREKIGQFHGRSSKLWNDEDNLRGRKTWFNFFDRNIKSCRHFWASLNYVNNNAVKHGYASRWQDWEFSSARKYLNEFGKEKAAYIWRKYPVLDYGKDWDVY